MRTVIALVTLLLSATIASAQDARVGWTRAPRAAAEPGRVFHATVGANLPTAETLQKGFYQFEISHRFIPPFSGGFEQLWGLDGPVNIRIGLGYGITDRLMLTLTRSNVRDNIDLQLKYGSPGWKAGSLPVRLGFVGGVAWNTDVPWRTGTNSRDFQGYAQGILNMLVADKWAIGVVPTFLYNAYLESDDVERALTLGLSGQWYLNRLVSLLAEWNIAERWFDYRHDAVAVGLELETGGHFFKIVATNSTALDPSQFVVGSFDSFDPDRWRLGFNITRLLKF
jgi:hypothetical protein